MTRKAVDIKILNTDSAMMVHFGRVVLEGGKITYDGLSAKFISELKTVGVIGDPKDGPIFPKDGERFLNALPREFRGTMIRASAVREIE